MFSPIVSNWKSSSRRTWTNDEHLLNALSSIFNTLKGIKKLDRDKHSENALLPIVIKDDGLSNDICSINEHL